MAESGGWGPRRRLTGWPPRLVWTAPGVPAGTGRRENEDEAPHPSTPFGEQLRWHRLAAGLTQEALAERAGLSPRTVQGLERGQTRPYRDSARRLAEALN